MNSPANQSAANVAYYGFTGLIDSANVTRIAAAFNTAVNNGCDEVYFCLSSLGGYVADGIYLYNHMRGLPIRITAHNVGNVSSIAVAIFVAADQRFCSAHSVFMIHPTKVSTDGGLIAESLQTSLDSALADDERTESILRERTSIPDDVLSARRFSDVYIPPDEATTHNLVDGVREFTLPQGKQIIQI